MKTFPLIELKFKKVFKFKKQKNVRQNLYLRESRNNKNKESYLSLENHGNCILL